MAIGEYIGLFSLGIMGTGIVALRPQLLELLILGAILMMILIMKVSNLIQDNLNKVNWGFIVLTSIGGIFASIGLGIMLSTSNLWFILNGVSWVGMGVILIKHNLDEAW